MDVDGVGISCEVEYDRYLHRDQVVQIHTVTYLGDCMTLVIFMTVNDVQAKQRKNTKNYFIVDHEYAISY